MEAASKYRMADSSNGYTLQMLIPDGATSVWKDYPTAALRILLLEEIHIVYNHIGAPKMAQLLRGRYYWPTLEKDCV
jgi:Integrase zinc binding domain